MSQKLTAAHISLWVNRFIALLVLLLIPGLPFLLNWYSTIRILTSLEYGAILIAFYCCVVVIGIALWNLDKLLCNILREEVFTRSNVSRIRTVRWCCGGISAICLPAAICYLPLLFVVLIMAFLCLVVSVLVHVLDAAVTIREENDLTI